MKCNDIMFLAYLWLTQCSTKSMLQQCGHSKTTIKSYRIFFQQLVSESLESDDTMIGGNNVIIEIDETKMGNLLI